MLCKRLVTSPIYGEIVSKSVSGPWLARVADEVEWPPTQGYSAGGNRSHDNPPPRLPRISHRLISLPRWRSGMAAIERLE